MSKFIELEIQSLLNETSDLDEVARLLIEKIESSAENLNRDNITALAKFLFITKKNKQLISFIHSHIQNKNFPIPWPYLLEAINHSEIVLDQKVLEAILEGITETGEQDEASRSRALNNFIPAFGNWRSNRKYKIHREYLEKKSSLIQQLATLRIQQLSEQEQNLLQKLDRLYPNDPEIHQELLNQKQRSALDILARRKNKIHRQEPQIIEMPDSEITELIQGLSASLLEHAKTDSEMAFEFAIAAFMLDLYETSFEILQYAEQTKAALWLRLELLGKTRRFAQLLAELAQIEKLFADDPETFFSTAYLRAQALWGLGQKHSAIEVIESLLASRPHYRAATALLNIWSGL